MTLLVTTICLVFGPADARCETRARVYPTRIECVRMVEPQKDYLTSEAEAKKAEIAHLFVGCKLGTLG